jgi:hypothetical protein
MQGNPIWPPPYPAPGRVYTASTDTAILLELSRLGGGLQSLELQLRLLDEKWDTRMEGLEKRIEEAPKPRKMDIPWAELCRATAPWIPGILIVILTIFGQTEIATSIASVFRGSPQQESVFPFSPRLDQ